MSIDRIAGGLSTEEAAARLGRDGLNALPEAEAKGFLRIVAEVVREPMLALLLVGGVVYLALGELSDALILVGFALFSVVVTIVQEARTERVLRSLRDLSNPKATVVRDGVIERIPSAQVVVGDCLLLQEGARVPADATVGEQTELQIDESLLTGESVAVAKRPRQPEDAASARPGGDGTPFVYSGTLVVRGQGRAEVIATGPRSELGRIGQSLSELQPEVPRLQKETRRIVAVFGLAGGIVSIVVVLLYGLLFQNWLNAILAGIALAMAMLPEEFPVVLTVFLAMGAWRISKANVLTRRATAIEALGSATVLCTDKTGTLTENRMMVTEVRLPGGDVYRLDGRPPVPAPIVDALRTGVLASAPQPFDPMDKAFHALSEPPEAGWSLAHSYGLRPELLAVAQAWAVEDADGYVVAAKGAPEAIASLCGLTGEPLGDLHEQVRLMAEAGLRVLGLATAVHDGTLWPDTPSAFEFRFVGLVGLSDALRSSVPGAVASCRTAGVRVIMITGDHPRTAQAIARQAGLESQVVHTGDDVVAADDEQLQAMVRHGSVFARILPEQKLRIVQALKRNGEVVAMTGDGVNDAPSLKAADIGVAMGGRGTDVAREAASLVLLDDDFGSIVGAIRLGRRIYDNLRKAMGFIVAVHIPVAGLALIPLLTGLPVLLWPVHIAFLEMIIDPMSSLAFEAEHEEPDIMNRPPRSTNARLLSAALIGWGVVQGAVVLGLVLALYATGRGLQVPDDELRAETYLALVAGILALVLANRSSSTSIIDAVRRPNATLLAVGGAIIAILVVLLAWPAASHLFGFGSLQALDLAVAGTMGLVALAIMEGAKSVSFWRRAALG